jgi:hypothetical protein
MLGVLEQVIGSIVGRKFDNRKGLASRRLIIKRKKYGVSDGIRNERDPQRIQADQPLTDADRGKIEQDRRKSATSRNQNSGSQDSSDEDSASDKERES